jgi:molecular chaperone DnaK
MMEEAKKHQSEDSHRKELVEARNNADSTVYQVEKQIKDLGDKLPVVDKTRIEEKIQEVKTVMQKDDLQVIRSKTEELTQMLGSVSAQANAQTPPPEQTGQQGSPPPDSDVVEGEFKET